VSEQTIYNHYGSKAELVRALIERRTRSISAPLDAPAADAHPEQALAAYARKLLEAIVLERSVALVRLLIASAPHSAAMARAVLPGGPRAMLPGGPRAMLTSFLERESRTGRLAIPDAREAADFFAGMVISHHQLHSLLGLPSELTAGRIERIAGEAARRFVRAYAV
jgi:AcrR family transcriptional regulator